MSARPPRNAEGQGVACPWLSLPLLAAITQPGRGLCSSSSCPGVVEAITSKSCVLETGTIQESREENHDFKFSQGPRHHSHHQIDERFPESVDCIHQFHSFQMEGAEMTLIFSKWHRWGKQATDLFHANILPLIFGEHVRVFCCCCCFCFFQHCNQLQHFHHFYRQVLEHEYKVELESLWAALAARSRTQDLKPGSWRRAWDGRSVGPLGNRGGLESADSESAAEDLGALSSFLKSTCVPPASLQSVSGPGSQSGELETWPRPWPGLRQVPVFIPNLI